MVEESEFQDIYKIAALDKIIHERARLAIMTVLYHREEVNFQYLKRALKTSEGNLATHIKALEGAGYVNVIKKFVRKKPQTSYQMTKKGRENYDLYVSTLRILANGSGGEKEGEK